jgi:hypothetical protein
MTPPETGQSTTIVNNNSRNHMKREKALEIVNQFPAEFDLDELIDRLVLVDKVEKGLDQLDNGQTVSHENVKEIIKKH